MTSNSLKSIKKSACQTFVTSVLFPRKRHNMSEITNVLEQLEGTHIHDILVSVEESYKSIYDIQHAWYENTKFTCPDGCGTCCINFEPDLMEAEALYMAAWLIENQPKIANDIANNNFPFDNGKTCPLYNSESKYHCSIYGGRAFICRLFGASSFYSKNHQKVWKPCKHYPEALLKAHNPSLEHKQYTEEETIAILGEIPPVMSDFLQSSSSFGTDTKKTTLLREILPVAINKLNWIIAMNGNDNPNGSPNTPMAA